MLKINNFKHMTGMTFLYDRKGKLKQPYQESRMTIKFG